MQTSDGFPRELLKESKKARFAYFNKLTLAHPLLMEAYEKLMHMVKAPGDVRLICLYGPSGVGKTTLLQRVNHSVLEQERSLMEQDLGYLPIVCVDAMSPDCGNFNWRDYYKRALEALDDPFYGHSRINFGQSVRWSGPEMRRALEKALKLRRVKTFIIDEAQHLTKMASGRKFKDQMDCIKSVSGVSGTAHVLAGTYELLDLRNLSGQLIRRSHDTHFRSYRVDQEEDKKAWLNLLRAFQKRLPLADEPDLVGQWEFCYERSVGCVGLLKEWLDRALRIALDRDLRTIDFNLLKQESYSFAQCKKLSDEIKEGMDQFAGKEGLRPRLREMLGLADDAGRHDIASQQEVKTKKKKGVSGRVGQRSPKRDKIGI
jgi:hypothetical protein